MARHDFNTLRPQLEAAINTRITQQGFPVDPQGYSLIDGFIQAPLQNVIGNDAGYALTGRSVPMVGIIGNSTGQVFYFAVARLIPGIQF